MNRFTPRSLALGWLLFWLPSGALGLFANEESGARPVMGFLQAYCTDCHGPDTQSGERRFDQLSRDIGDDSALVDWQDILDQLNLGDMPPPDAPQPSAAERLAVIEQLTQRIAAYHQTRQQTEPQPRLRRLNRREYRHTIGDLLGLNMSMFDPTTAFPRDQTVEHLDNASEALVTSGYLLARYLEAADRAVSQVCETWDRPAVQHWSFQDGFDQQPEIDQVHRRTNKFTHLTLYDVTGADKHEGAYAPIHAFAQGVPYSGFYEIRFQAQAHNRDHPYDDDFLGRDRREPLRLGLVAGQAAAGSLHKPQPIEPLLAELDMADELQWYSVRVWLDRGFTPRFTFRNGLMDARNLWSRVQKRYPDMFPKPKRKGIVEARYNAIAYGQLPQIHIEQVEISGPFYDQWPTASQQLIFGGEAEQVLKAKSLSDATARKYLNEFLRRAYRRDATSDEIDRIMSVIQIRRSTGRSELEAYADGLKAALCSPHFLLLGQPGQSDETSQADKPSQADKHWALASRMSYLLWASMPDDTLLQLAEQGRLNESTVLLQQTERMLADPRSDQFLSGFLDSWLTLRDLGTTPPDRGDFPGYYQYDLESAMRRETELFARHLLDENLSIGLFLDADFTFVNKRLAWHYGLPVPEAIARDGGKFCRVQLPDRRRGGLLGHASVLTVTANGLDTSPVVRGVWMLENILGTPPAPPPPDVEPLDPDVRGAKSIREQLEKHRSLASCRSCHRKFDPLGFALENFDAVGQWRDNYGPGKPVDASGDLGSAGSFQDVAGLKSLLEQRHEQFAQALIRKLLAYALGRQLAPSDRPEVDRIGRELRERGWGFRDLVRLVTTSPLFRDG